MANNIIQSPKVTPLFTSIQNVAKSTMVKSIILSIIAFLILCLLFKYRPSFSLRSLGDQPIEDDNIFVNRRVVFPKNYSIAMKDLRFKCAYNCCNNGRNKPSSIHSLKKIIGYGIRFLDFAIERFENNVIVIDQRSDESFYDVLKTIQSRAFSNHYCQTYNLPIFINLRIHYSSNPLSNQLLLERLAEIFRSVNNESDFNFLPGAQYHHLNKPNNQAILSASLSDLKRKIVVFCNYDEQKIKDDSSSSSSSSPFMEYLHLITVHYNDLNANHSITNSLYGLVMFDESFFSNTVSSVKSNDLNHNYSNMKMICPSATLSNPTSIYRALYNIRAIDVSSVSSFDNYRNDQDIQVVHFLDDVNTDGVIYS